MHWHPLLPALMNKLGQLLELVLELEFEALMELVLELEFEALLELVFALL
jgi:hypothetical protein